MMNLYNKKIRENKGITLIALVVTIVVLLILAVISIQMLRGDNGIVKQAVKSKEETAIAREKEILNVSLSAIRSDNQGSLIFTEGELQNELRKHTDDVEVRKSTDTLYLVKYTDSNREYEVTPDGKVEVATPRIDPDKVTPWDDKKNDDTVMLQCIEDLVQLSKDVNEGVNTYDGKTFKLEVDLNFQSINSYKNSNTTEFGDVNGNGSVEPLITELTTGQGFTPIGNYQFPFAGNLDGQGHRLISLTEKRKSNHSGFIGYSDCEYIKNIKMENVNITEAPSYAAAIIAQYAGSDLSITDCRVSGKISGKSETAGIIANSYKYDSTGMKISIKGCINDAIVETTSGRVAGIVSQIQCVKELTLEDCENNGQINGNSSISGIISEFVGISGGSYSVKIRNCKNNSDLYANPDQWSMIGGILNYGYNSGNLLIDNCTNYGNINSIGSYVGGIISRFYDENTEVRNCINHGNINGGNHVGGITGRLYNKGSIYNCINFGDISGGYGVGGILGQGEYGGVSAGVPSVIENCYNTGKITATSGDYAGGIAGRAGMNGTDYVNLCYNIGEVSATNATYVGGITGDAGGSAISNCYNTATVNGRARVGGIAGESSSSGEIKNTYNLAPVTGQLFVGGIAGYENKDISNSYNFGKVTTTTNAKETGAIAGISYGAGQNDCYYLKGTYNVGVGALSNNGTDTTIEKESEEEMKNLMKEKLVSLEEWILEEGKEYPTLNMGK